MKQLLNSSFTLQIRNAKTNKQSVACRRQSANRSVYWPALALAQYSMFSRIEQSHETPDILRWVYLIKISTRVISVWSLFVFEYFASTLMSLHVDELENPYRSGISTKHLLNLAPGSPVLKYLPCLFPLLSSVGCVNGLINTSSL
jgi:hypothetical protein